MLSGPVWFTDVRVVNVALWIGGVPANRRGVGRVGARKYLRCQ